MLSVVRSCVRERTLGGSICFTICWLASAVAVLECILPVNCSLVSSICYKADMDQIRFAYHAAVGVNLIAAASLVMSARARGLYELQSIERFRSYGLWDRFTTFKFRTKRILESDAPIVQTRRDDDRLARLGKILWRSSIVELPQLINILRGDMSVVGPGPHVLSHDGKYKSLIGNYALCHQIKPGLTGAEQIRLRGETQQLLQMEQRIERDIWHVRNWSFTLDIKIFLRTCFDVLPIVPIGSVEIDARSSGKPLSTRRRDDRVSTPVHDRPHVLHTESHK